MFSSPSVPLKHQFWFCLPAISTTNWACEAAFHIENNAIIISFHFCRTFFSSISQNTLNENRQHMKVPLSWSYLREKLFFVGEMVAVVFPSDWHHLSCPEPSLSVSRTLDLLKLVHTPASQEREDCLGQSPLPFSLWWTVTYTVRWNKITRQRVGRVSSLTYRKQGTSVSVRIFVLYFFDHSRLF